MKLGRLGKGNFRKMMVINFLIMVVDR